MAGETRQEYRELTDREKEHIQSIKTQGEQFIYALHSAGGTIQQQERQSSRELSIAQTKIEEAVMWAVKHITRSV